MFHPTLAAPWLAARAKAMTRLADCTVPIPSPITARPPASSQPGGARVVVSSPAIVMAIPAEYTAAGFLRSVREPATHRPTTEAPCMVAMNRAGFAVVPPGPKAMTNPYAAMPTRNGNSTGTSPDQIGPDARALPACAAAGSAGDAEPGSSITAPSTAAVGGIRSGSGLTWPGTRGKVSKASNTRAAAMSRNVSNETTPLNHSPIGAPTAAAADVVAPNCPRARPARPGRETAGTAAVAKTTRIPKPQPTANPVTTKDAMG